MLKHVGFLLSLFLILTFGSSAFSETELPVVERPHQVERKNFELLAIEKLKRPNPKDIISEDVKAKIRAKLERRLSASLMSTPVQIRVDETDLKPARNLDELLLRLQEMYLRIENASRTTVDVKIGGTKFYINRKPLGEGLTGVVYQSLTESRVIKFPSPDVVGINGILDEGFITSFAPALRTAGLDVAEPIEIHDQGLYAIKRAAPPVDLTRMLMRSKLLRVEGGRAVRASASEMRLILKADPSMQKVASMLMKMVQVRRAFPTLNLDLGPANIHFEYNAIGQDHLVLVDTGRSGQSTKAAIDSIRTFDQYLDFAVGITNRYLETGVMRARSSGRTCGTLFRSAG